MAKSVQELTKLRQELLKKISPANYDWVDVKLAGNIAIKVCKPVKIDGFYVPVTAKETRDFARSIGAFPLTRAVADQILNNGTFIPYHWQPELHDFEKYSAYLNSRGYDGVRNFGAHKLWVLSSRGKAVNYGFYEAIGSKPSTGGGSHLKPGFNVRQSLGGAHNEHHWDYSQLLQIMFATTPLEIGGSAYSLGMALVAGLPAVWDESQKLQQSDLP